MDADGRKLRRLTNHPDWDHEPAWSPDGRQIVFTSGRDQNRSSDIYVMDTNGRNLRRLTNHPGLDSFPAWSPNGRRIAFTSTRDEKNNFDIYIMNADGGSPHRLTNNPAMDNFPAWSPDGRRIAFSSWRDGGGIYVMDANGHNIVRLTSGEDQFPVWSPDGWQIAFEGGGPHGPNREIFVIDVDGKKKRNLTHHPDPNCEPDWFDPAVARAVSLGDKGGTIWGWLKQMNR